MNLLTILVAALVAMVVGAIYYAPPIFGNYWMKLTGLKMTYMKKDTVWVMYLLTFAAAIVMTYVLSFLMGFLQTRSVGEAIKLAFWVWLGFVLTTSLTNALYSRKPLKLFFLENGHHLLVMIVVSVILALWK